MYKDMNAEICLYRLSSVCLLFDDFYLSKKKERLSSVCILAVIFGNLNEE